MFVDGNVGTIGISLEPVLEAVGTTIAAGSTVHVLNGVYHEAPQITINADVNIVGQDRSGTIVKAAGSTGSSSNDNSRGWFLVAEGVTLNVSHMTFDGNGNNIFQAFRHRGSGTFEDVAFHDIQFRATGPNYAGTAIAAFGSASNVDVIDSIFSQIGRIGVQFFGSGTTGEFRGNTYTGKGIGNHLDYAVEVGGGAVSDILNNTITNNRGIAASDGSSSAGILVTTFFGAGSSASIQNNFINGNRHGVVVGFNASDTSMVAINNNDLSGNCVSAVRSTAAEVNAECNWWGIANAAAIQAMLGGAGSANIDFMPFLTSGADTSADAGFQGDLSSCV